MLLSLLLLLWTGTPQAFAGEPGAHAEAVRLSVQLQSLARRDHWAGVEHVYLLALATGEPLPWQDHLAAAHAALTLGDVASARERLMLAKGAGDERTVIETLWQIDTHFTPVDLHADPGTELGVAAMPFDPQQARAVERARDQLRETGAFHGMLPLGDYALGGTWFGVTPDRLGTAVEIDTRSAGKRQSRRR